MPPVPPKSATVTIKGDGRGGGSKQVEAVVN